MPPIPAGLRGVAEREVSCIACHDARESRPSAPDDGLPAGHPDLRDVARALRTR